MGSEARLPCLGAGFLGCIFLEEDVMFFAHNNSWAFRLPRGLSEPSAITKGIQRQEHATHNTSNTNHLFTEFCHRAERNPLSEHVRPLLYCPPHFSQQRLRGVRITCQAHTSHRIDGGRSWVVAHTCNPHPWEATAGGS